MYNKLTLKMRSHFGPDSLIIYSRHCDYYQINPIKKDDIQIYYDYLMSDQVQKNHKNINDIACCLYYLSENNENYKDKFTSLIIENLDINNDPINDRLMILIYNIIEFVMKHIKSDKDKLQFLLWYLERFSSLSKNKTNFLLFKYYRGALKLRLGDIPEANKENLEFVMQYTEEIICSNSENKYTLFIKLQNDLLNVKIFKLTQGDDIRQTRMFLKELYDQTKSVNQFLAIRIGFELYDIFLKENSYNECIEILMNMRTILKKKLLTGDRMNNAIDYYLAIVSRLGFVGVLTNNKAAIENSIKKMKKSIDMFDKYNEKQNREKIQIFKNAYSFLLTIIREDNKEKIDEDKQRNIAANFKSLFLPDLKSSQIKKFGDKFIVNKSNFYNFVVNLVIINDVDIDVESFWNKEVYKPLISIVEKNNPLQQNCIMAFVLSMHYKVQKYCRSYCQEENDNQRIKYKNNIVELAQRLMFYLNNYGEDEILFRTQFIKSAVIDIISAYAHVLIYNKEFKQLKGLVQRIDSMEKTYGFSENTPSYDLICKIKGDFWLLSNFKDYQASIMQYQRGYRLLQSNHPKKPIILFNIAYCYYVSKDKKNALDYLNRCVYEFNHIPDKNVAPDFYYRPNAISKKILLAKKMINILNANK